MELYQAVHLLTTQSDENNLQYLLLEYALKMTYSKAAFIMQDGKIIKSLGDIINKEEVEQKLFKPMQKIKTSPITVIIDKDKYIIAPVKPNYKTCGFIAVTFPNSLNFNKAKTHNHANIEISNNNFDKYVSEQLTFLSELGTTALEKFELEKINKNLLINEEQNRIANEIMFFAKFIQHFLWDLRLDNKKS